MQQASADDVDRAVASAGAGFAEWRAMTGAARGRILNDAARLLRARNAELAALEVSDTGKPIAEAIAVDVLSGADCIEYFAGARRHDPRRARRPRRLVGLHPARAARGVRRHRGVELPAADRLLEVGAGAGVRQRDGVQAGRADATDGDGAGRRSYTEAGVPDGVFNVVQGDARVGRALSEHPGIAKVSLTGEVGTGRRVMAQASAGLKDVTLELGGKSPLIVFDDAHLDNAVSASLLANFYTQGEVCSNGTRVFVHRSIEHEFVERVVARTAKMVVGDPTDPATHVGALISAEHQRKVLDYIERRPARRRRAALRRRAAGRSGARRRAGSSSRRCSPAAPTT